MLMRALRQLKSRSSLVDSIRFRSFLSTIPSSPSPPLKAFPTGEAADVGEIHGEGDVSMTETNASPTLLNVLQPRVVVYDGVCPLCHGGVKWVIKADKHRKIKFCCVQSMAAEPYLRISGRTREDVMKQFLFVEGLGFYHQASTAVLRVLSYLPLPYSALSMLSVVPTPLRDAVYDYVANHRYQWFGKADDCLVLKEKELLDRFIDRDELKERM